MVFEDGDNLEGDFDICLFKFSQQMPEIFRICDFALSRAGASSLWELCANGLPSLFIPYPYAASNHQYFNAKFLENKNLGFLCEEKNLFDEVLWDILGYLEEEKIRLQKEKEKLESEVQRAEKMLSNPGFTSKAPESKINEEKEKLEKYKEMLRNTVERLEKLK